MSYDTVFEDGGMVKHFRRSWWDVRLFVLYGLSIETNPLFSSWQVANLRLKALNER